MYQYLGISAQFGVGFRCTFAVEIINLTAMTKYKLKKTKTEESIVNAYKRMEAGVVKGYQAIEDTVVGAYQKIEDKFVEAFLEKENEEKQ